MKKVVVASLLAVASSVPVAAPAVFAQAAATPAGGAQNQTGTAGGAQSGSGSITIKDPAEYNAYTAAVGQTAPAAKAQAIEAFLTQYPNTVVKQDMLEQLVGAYQQAGDTPHTVDASKRLLQVDPNNLRALAFVVYVEKSQAQGDQSKLDQAAADAQKGIAGLSNPKPASMSDADYAKLKTTVTPIFYGAVAADDVAKKDYKSAIDAYQSDLKSFPDPADTQKGPGLMDTYLMGQAYAQEDPKDLPNAIWYLTRAAQFAQPPYKDSIEKAAEYWYNKYHGGMDGFDAIKALAVTSVTPPDSYKPVAAPPPPSPADLAHQAVTSTPDLTKMALSDKEFVLANGSTDDAEKVWATMKDHTFAIKGKVVQVASDGSSVQFAVSDDAQQSNTADFTINMKEPLKTPPAVGATVTYDATFDSYTQKPAMIILKDGAAPAAKAAAPVHHRAR